MRKEYAADLIFNFPDLYRKLRNQDFECDDGWYGLIKELSESINKTSFTRNSSLTGKSYPSILIVKQKFGILRVTFEEEVDEEITLLLKRYSDMSKETCEICGLKGSLQLSKKHSRNIKSLCDSCKQNTGWL
jgi:hypothetical protein